MAQRIFFFLVGLMIGTALTASSPVDISGAVRSFETGDSESARLALEEIVTQHPDHAEAHLYLGRIALADDDRKTALDFLKSAVDLSDSSEAHLWFGRALLAEMREANMFAKASLAPRLRRAFEIAVERDPENLEALDQLGNFYLNAPAIGGGSKAKARQVAEAIIALDPARGYAFLARVLSSSADVSGAIDAYQSALEHDPDDANLLYRLGMAYQQSEHWNEAFAAFERVTRVDPAHQHAVYQYGRTGALSGRNLDRAAEILEHFIRELAEEGTSYYGSAHWRLGMIRDHQGDRAAARRCYQQALERDPDLSDARKALRKLDRSD